MATDHLAFGEHDLGVLCEGRSVINQSFSVFVGVSSAGTAAGSTAFFGVMVAALSFGFVWRTAGVALVAWLARSSRRDND